MKGIVIETFLPLEKGQYPFSEPIHPRTTGFVQELQYFGSRQRLLSRRAEMQRSSRSFQGHSIIKLFKIYEEQLCLHYIYEYIPLSLPAYIQQQLSQQQTQLYHHTTAKLLLRTLTRQVEAVANELAKLRLQTELSYAALGVKDNRIKLFVSSQHQMGRKSQVMLKEHYRTRKDAVIHTLEQQFSRIIGEKTLSPNYGNKGTKIFPTAKRQAGNHSDSNESSFCLNDTYVNCETKDTNFRQREKERRYSQTKWDAHEWRKFDRENEKLRNTQSPSFVNHINLDKPRMGGSKLFEDSANQEDNFDGRSYCHSKSIRIQLQKNKKKRKDSYKVKVITCHQYQMDDIDPKDLFFNCDLSESSHSSSPPHPQFKDKVKQAAARARDLLNGYLHRRRNSRK